MATQRIKNMEIIQQPYQRTSNQIHNLQVKDKILHSSIISLRDRIQNSRNDRNCKSCKIYEDEIVLIKNQQKQKTSKFEQKIQRLEEENKNLTKDIIQMNSTIPTFHQKTQMIKPIFQPQENSLINPVQLNKIVNQTNLLNNIDQTNNQLQVRQKRQREILNKLRRKKDKSTNKILNNKDDNINQEHQILLYLSEIQQKYGNLQQFKNQLQKELQQKNKQNAEDSLRIINLLNQIDNYRQQFHNIEQFYQLKCRQIEQQKDKIVFQFNLKQKNFQNQINTLKSYIQSSNRIKQSLSQLKQTKQSEISTLRKQKNDLQLLVAKTNTQLQYMNNDKISKEHQIGSLCQSLSLLQTNNFQLQKQIVDYKHYLEQSDQKCKALALQITNLKQSNSKLESNPTNFNKEEEIQYLKNMLNQNHLVVSNRQENINKLQSQISTLRSQNKSLKDNEEHHLIALTSAEELNNERNKFIKYLQKEKAQIIRQLKNTIQQKTIVEQELSKQVQSKTNFAQKYILQAEKNSDLYKKYNIIQRQFEQFKRTRNTYAQSVQNNKRFIDQLSHQISQNKIHVQNLNEENKHLKMDNQCLHAQLRGLKQQIELNISLKEGRQKEIQGKNKQLEQVIYFNNQMYQDIEHFRAQNNFLVNKIRELQHILLQLQQNCNRSIRQLQQAELQRIALLQSISQHQNKINNLEQQHLSERQNLQQMIDSQRDQILLKKQDIKKRERIIQQERHTSSVLAKINNDLQNKNKKYSQENTHLQKYVSQLLHELDSISKANELLSKTSSPAIKIKDNNHEDKSKVNVQMQQKTLKILQLQDKLNEIQHQYDNLRVSYDKLNKKNQMLIEAQSINTENILYLNQKIQSLNKVYLAPNGETTEELIKQLNKKKQMVTQLLTNFKYVQKALNSKEAQLNQLVQKHQKLGKLAGKQKFQLGDKLLTKQAELNTMKRQKDQESKRLTSKIKQMQKIIAHLQDQLKQKDRQQIQQKRHTQKQINRVAQQKKKFQQTSCKEIMQLKQTLQSQKKRSNQVSLTTSPAKQQEPNKKQKDYNLKKTIEDNKRKIRELEQQLRNKEIEIQKLRNLIQQRDYEIQQINAQLIEAQVKSDVASHQIIKYQSKITLYQKEIEKLQFYISEINVKYKLGPKQDINFNIIESENQEQNLIEGIKVAQQNE